MLNIAICDDVPEICEQISAYIKEYNKDNGENFCAYTANDAKILYEIMKKQNIDLLFLDIELPCINGVEIGSYIRSKMQDDDMQIVYISAIKDYSMELFHIRPNNFLIKPITKEQITKELDIALKLSNKKEKTFKFCVNKKEIKKKTRDIIYFESSGHKTKIVTINETIEFYKPMKDLYQELKTSGFAMCHNSYLINIDKIIWFSKNAVTMSDGTNIKISRTKRDEFLKSVADFDLN